MKTVRILLVLLALGLLGACVKDQPGDCLNSDALTVRFKGSIDKLNLRAGNTEWDSNDAIGIFAVKNGQSLADAVYNNFRNVEYTTSGDGDFLVASGSDAITFPSNGSALDFIAYYPYDANLNGHTVALNLSEQSVPAAIDFLYSNNATAQTQSQSAVDMTFRHMLSKLIVTVKRQSGEPLGNDFKTMINDVVVDGSFDLATASLSSGNSRQTIVCYLEMGKDKMQAQTSAIVMPEQSLADLEYVFVNNGKKYTWHPSAQTLKNSKKYMYSVLLQDDGQVVAVNPHATIEDWGAGNTPGNDIVVAPDEEMFMLDKTAINFGAEENLIQTLHLTAGDQLSWTVENSADWLNVSEMSGTGSKELQITANANTESNDRNAEIRFKADGQNDLVLTLTQKGKTVTPQPDPTTGKLLFPGADFEDWDAFLGALNHYGLKKYISQSDNGRNGSKAMLIETNGASRNDYLFTAEVPTSGGLEGKSKIHFYIKGTVSGKSLSLNLYKDQNEGGGYAAYNLGEVTDQDLTISEVGAGKYGNDYNGNIDTKGKWVKVTIDFHELSDLAKVGNMFAIKIGEEAATMLYIDDIVVE